MAFDVDTFARMGGRLDLGDLDLERGFEGTPLDDASLRCLQYMHDIEHHTSCYLRDILVTKAHQDPVMTTFLTVWSYEEHWHGEAIGRVLATHGRPAGSGRVASVRAALPRTERWRPLSFLIGSTLFPDMVTVQLVWGAVNEWTTQAGYNLLARRSGHPVLGDLLRRIMRQEGKHIDFYMTEARRRLATSRRAQRLARFALRRYWHPVGYGVRPEEETAFLVKHLFAGEEGRRSAQRIDRQVDRLPGVSGLHLVEGVVDLYAA
ncbi:MAG: ferritin-like domain-containing protein [Acidimicrobiales bacterium]